MNRHDQLQRDKFLREIHESMLRHRITFEEIEDYAKNRYIDRATRMEEIRTSRLREAKVRENLRKAREAKQAKAEGK